MATYKEQNKQNVPHLRFSEFHGEWEKCKLGDIAEFSTARISSVKLDCKNYVSTENMLQDFQGVVEAKSVPNETNVISFTCGDILIVLTSKKYGKQHLTVGVLLMFLSCKQQILSQKTICIMLWQMINLSIM